MSYCLYEELSKLGYRNKDLKFILKKTKVNVSEKTKPILSSKLKDQICRDEWLIYLVNKNSGHLSHSEVEGFSAATTLELG